MAMQFLGHKKDVNECCERNSVRLTPFFNLPPHFPDLPLMVFRRRGVEASDFVILFVCEDGVGEGGVFGFGHLIFGDGREGRQGRDSVGGQGRDLEIGNGEKEAEPCDEGVYNAWGRLEDSEPYGVKLLRPMSDAMEVTFRAGIRCMKRMQEE